MSTGPNTNTSWPGGRKVRDDVEQILSVTVGTIRPISLRTLASAAGLEAETLKSLISPDKLIRLSISQIVCCAHYQKKSTVREQGAKANQDYWEISFAW